MLAWDSQANIFSKIQRKEYLYTQAKKKKKKKDHHQKGYMQLETSILT